MNIENTAVTAIPDFNAALGEFVAATQEKINAEYARIYQHVQPPKLVAERGVKNVKIVSAESNSRSVFCFVRIADGAILKAASWKAPAKHSRGSIYVNRGQEAVSIYGANYIR
jgi:hypothetical protein